MSELGFQVASVPGVKGCATTVFSHIRVSVWRIQQEVHSLNTGRLMNPIQKVHPSFFPLHLESVTLLFYTVSLSFMKPVFSNRALLLWSPSPCKTRRSCSGVWNWPLIAEVVEQVRWRFREDAFRLQVVDLHNPSIKIAKNFTTLSVLLMSLLGVHH